jgi:hypothetical protein
VSNALTVSEILKGAQPANAAEACRLLTIHGTRARAMRSTMEREGDARKAARIRTELGKVETAIGLLETWAAVL